MSQKSVLAQFQAANEEWRKAVLQVAPDFFEKSAKGQTPKVLWFGCADSRVPESVVLAAKPGDLFVHRNIAKYAPHRPFRNARFPSTYLLTNFFFPSQFHPDDDSALSVLTYAVEHVGVQHGSSFSHRFRTTLTPLSSLSDHRRSYPVRRVHSCMDYLL